MRRTRSILSALLLSIISLFFVSTRTGCGPYDSGSEDITVLVTVEGLTGAVSSLSVTTTLNGAPSQNSIPELTQRLDKFAIYLPRNTSGLLNVTLVGHSADSCVVAKGQAEVEIRPAPPTFVRLSVPISTSAVGSTKQCALKVELHGNGKVTSTPAGIDCSSTVGKAVTCSGDFPVGTSITLNSKVDAKVYGVSFEGPCKGAGSCSFMFTTPGTVKVGFAGRVCSKDNWCWYSPLPHGNTLRAVWGSAADDYWAVGDMGTIMHYDGGAWSGGAPTGFTASDLQAVYGTSATDVWAVGTNSGLVRYDGNKWTASPQSGVIPAPAQTLRGLWGRAPNDYWAVGSGGTILHFDGNLWSEAPGSRTATTRDLYAVWGSSAGDVWTVGNSGVVLHYNGTNWTLDTVASNLSTATTWYGLAGSAADRIFAVGSSGRVMRYNGTAWSLDPMSGNIGLSTAYSLWMNASGALTVGYSSFSGVGSSRFDGNAWQYTAAPGGVGIYGVWATSLSDAWTVGDYGTLMHYDGQSWSAPPISTTLDSYTLQNVWGSAPNDVWAVGSGGTIRRFNGETWAPYVSNTTNGFQNVWGFATQVFAVGNNGTFMRYDSTNTAAGWQNVTWAAVPPTNTLYGIWGSSQNAVWATGTNGIFVSYNGTMASVIQNPNTLTSTTMYSIHGVSSSNIFATGGYSMCPPGGMINCNMFRYSGAVWSSQLVNGAAGMTTLRGIWGYSTPNTRYWAVGSGGTIAFFDGGTWTTHAQSGVLTNQTLFDIWGTSASNIFAVGYSSSFAPLILRYEGVNWASMEPGTRSYTLNGVWSGASNDAWAVGSSGVVLRYMP